MSRIHALAVALTVPLAAFMIAMTGMQDAPKANPAAPAQPTTPAAPAKTFVLMTTNKGDILLELDPEKAPISVANFMNYARKGAYDGTIFHRVIGDFMIQGGGFGTDLVQKPTNPAIKNEWQNGLKNSVGTIAMARTNDPNSATNQFFINVGNNSMRGLDGSAGSPGYAVFGRVVGGMEVVEAIKKVATGTKNLTMNTPAGPITQPARDVPVENVVIVKVSELSAADAMKKIKPAAPAAPGTPGAPAAPTLPGAPTAPAAPSRPAAPAGAPAAPATPTAPAAPAGKP